MLRLEAVSKVFKGRNGKKVVALDGVDLVVEQGELLTVTGPSGSGKSTLLFAMGAMQAPSGGVVRMGPTSLYDLGPAGRARLRRQRIGFVFQTFNLVPYLSCAENVAVPAMMAGKPRRAALSRAEELLERVDLGHRLKHRPFELSVGERQRAAVCRAVVNEPDVLLADEPTGNLDEERTEQVVGLLLELHRAGQTIVMATHDGELACRGTRALHLVEGRVASTVCLADPS